MLSRLARAAVLLPIGLAAACSSLPEPGFATRYLGGTLAGPVQSRSDPGPRFIPETAQSEPATQRPDDLCAATARDRASDAGSAGFGAATQKKVYDAALADCRAWMGRR